MLRRSHVGSATLTVTGNRFARASAPPALSKAAITARRSATTLTPRCRSRATGTATTRTAGSSGWTTWEPLLQQQGDHLDRERLGRQQRDGGVLVELPEPIRAIAVGMGRRARGGDHLVPGEASEEKVNIETAASSALSASTAAPRALPAHRCSHPWRGRYQRARLIFDLPVEQLGRKRAGLHDHDLERDRLSDLIRLSRRHDLPHCRQLPGNDNAEQRLEGVQRDSRACIGRDRHADR